MGPPKTRRRRSGTAVQYDGFFFKLVSKHPGAIQTVLALVFQLLRSAAKKWRILGEAKRLAEVVRGVKFVDGIQQEDAPLLEAVHNI